MCAAPAPAVEYIGPAPAVSYAAPAAMVFATSALVVEYIAPAPRVSYAAPERQCLPHHRQWKKHFATASVSYAAPAPTMYAAPVLFSTSVQRA